MAERTRGEAHPVVQPLYNGDCMDQEEFHNRYLQCPQSERFQLVNGVVYSDPPRTSYWHGLLHHRLSYVLGHYERATPGTDLVLRVTTILDSTSEVLPDLLLWVSGQHGGQAGVNLEGYFEGAPELIAEIAYSSRSIEFHQKRLAYERAGVGEYLIVNLDKLAVVWFDFRAGEEIGANRKGVMRSRIFPGLWIHSNALVCLDDGLVDATWQAGLASREHAAFVKRLARQKK